MRGALVYSPEGYALNQWFADRLIASAAAHGLSLALKVLPCDWSDERPDFAIVRAIAPELSADLEARGVRVFNNAVTSWVANDKFRTYELARELGLPVLPTEPLERPRTPSFGFPAVVKSRDGHGGEEVFLVSDLEELTRVFVATGKTNFIAQPLCDDPGKDMRLYAVGGEARAAVLRTSRTDFRSNFKLGGDVEAVAPVDEQRRVVRRLHERLGFDFVGVDFISHGGKWILNEVEDVVGTRMLYATTALDAAALLMDRVFERLRLQEGEGACPARP